MESIGYIIWVRFNAEMDAAITSVVSGEVRGQIRDPIESSISVDLWDNVAQELRSELSVVHKVGD